MSIGRKIMAIVRSAGTWAIGWGALMTGIAVIGVSFSSVSLPAGFWAAFITRQAIGGAINGVVFAVALMVIGRRQTFATLSVARIAACGAMGGIVFPLISIAMIPASVLGTIALSQLAIGCAVSVGIGAIIGGGSLLLARRAPAIGTNASMARIDAGTA
jgi:hypothetical protein